MTEHPPILPLELQAVRFEAGGKRLIKDISATFEADQRTVIIGPNGAGKSLLLRLCHGLLAPHAGRVVWHGPGEPARRQAMVFQRPVMLRRSVRANLEFALSVQKVPRPEWEARIDKVLGRTGLRRLTNKPARVLSFGEQQKLALARAWVLEPQILFLDEATANLDPPATHSLEEILADIAAEGTKLVMVTHDLGQAKRMADEVIFMHRGRILERAPADRFFDAPENDLAQDFLAGRLLWWKKREKSEKPPL